jgi:hypothetical protein
MTKPAPITAADRNHNAIGREPSRPAAEHENVDERRCEQQRHRDHGEGDCRDAHRKHIGQRNRRRHDQVEIGARVKHPRHGFDRLRQHQGPCQETAGGDDDQRRLVQRLLQIGEAADHGIGRQMHDRDKDDQPDRSAALS